MRRVSALSNWLALLIFTVIIARKVIRHLQPYHMMTPIMITMCVVLDMEEHIVKV